MFDKHDRGYITREDFKAVFEHFDGLRGMLNEQELNDFIEGFWKDRSRGIDYKGFLQIFKKYELQVDNEMQAKGQKAVAPILDDTVRLKKEIFDALKAAFVQRGTSYKDFFNLVDEDGNYELSEDELASAFAAMKLGLTSQQAHQIFTSIDFDGSGDVSLPEFIADFNHVVSTPIEELVAMN